MRKAKPMVVFVVVYEFWAQAEDGIYEYRHCRVSGVFKTRDAAELDKQTYLGGECLSNMYRKVRIQSELVR